VILFRSFTRYNYRIMNPRQCVFTALDRREPDRLPYFFTLEPGIEAAVNEALGGDSWREDLVTFIEVEDLAFPHRETMAGGRYVDGYGSQWESGSIMHLVRPALSKPSLGGFAWPDVDALWHESRDALKARFAGHTDRFRAVFIPFGPFERAWTLRGFTEILTDMIAEPAFCEDLFEAILHHQMDMIEHLVTLDIDAVLFSDDWGQQNGLIMGPDLWRRYLKPRMAKMIGRVHEAGKKAVLHCCGCVTEILPEIIDMGLDCLESVQPEAMDVFELKRIYGRDIAFWGGGPSQSLIPFGPPEEIQHRFKRLRDEVGAGGGYICAPAKEILDGTPVANAVAAIEGLSGTVLRRS